MIKEIFEDIYLISKLRRLGTTSITSIVVLVLMDGLKLFPLDYVHPYLKIILLFILLLNTSGVSWFTYLDKQERISLDKFCFDCGEPVEVIPRYKCPKCGEITIGEK